MSAATLPQLVADATLVAEAGARLGWLDPGADLLPAIAAARRTASGDDAAALEQRLHQALNAAVKAIAPITLDDLRRGWRPYETTLPRRIGIACFFVFSVALMVFCAYASQVYERARSTDATTLELQDARGAEQAMRLFGMLKRNQQEVEESLSTGKKEFLYEVFGKALFDLKAMQVKNLAYAPIASNTLNDLEMLVDPAVALQRLRDPANPSGLREVQGWLKATGYGPNPPAVAAEGGGAGALPVAAAQAAAPAPAQSAEARAPDVLVLLDSYLKQLRRFNLGIELHIDPLQPQDYFSNLFRLRNGIAFVGLWVLPALYGMLGAVVFHLRRILDPATPELSWMRITFRVLLGGFAGIIVVWFWTPSASKLSQAEFVTLSSFGLAFLVGFSTDVFFRALDRLVDYLTQALSPPSSQRRANPPPQRARGAAAPAAPHPRSARRRPATAR